MRYLFHQRTTNSQKSLKFSRMEVEEEEELGELCAEILENWNSPIYSEENILHRNPFSLYHHHHHQPLNTPDDIQTVSKKQDTTFSCTNMETKITMSKRKFKDPKQDFELGQEDKRRLTTPKPVNYKGFKYGEANVKSNSKRSIGRSIIPVLVADTFYDKLLGHAVDGIDIAALNNIKAGNAFKNVSGPSRVSANYGKRMEKLGSIQGNFPAVSRMPKRFPISGERKCIPSTSTAVPITIRNTFQRGFIAKPSFMLPSKKTIFDINIDDFGEKMWRKPGVDLSDFFNYGLNEKQWKYYCKLMQAQIQKRRFRGSNITTDEGRQSLKDGIIISEVKLDKEKDKCRPSRDSKDSSSYNSDVIIEIALCDSPYDDEIRRQLIRKYGVLSDDGGANLRSNSRNTATINCRMINGDRISPFPLDNCSAEDGQWVEEPSQKHFDTHFTNSSSDTKTELSITHSEVELTGSNEMVKQQSSGKKGEYLISHVGQRSQKRFRLYDRDQTTHHKVDLNLVESFYSPQMESVRDKREYYMSQGVQMEPVKRIFPTNSHSTSIKMEVKEDPEKMKRRKERFSCPLPILNNIVT